MNWVSHPFTSVACLTLALSACSTGAKNLSQKQAADLAWQALKPNTSSRDPSVWEIADLRSVSGREIAARFDGGPVPGACAPGPIPPANMPISADESYWYVQFRPRPVTPLPQPTEQFSPTAPPSVPEPFVYEARFLISAVSGQVIARKLLCVIY